MAKSGEADEGSPAERVTLGSWRGPLQVHCGHCGEFKRARSLKLPRTLDEGKRRFYYVREPDIAWFRRRRSCTACGTEFLTAEVDETLIEELLRLRQREARRRSVAYAKVGHDFRVRQKWLDTTGDDVPRELAAELVRGSAWWLTHSSGSPVRAPRHADRLQKLYCGWSVDFGANWFAAGRALARARDYTKSVVLLASEGKLPAERELKRRLRNIPSGCVLNVNRDFYDDYPENGAGELVFGAQAIDTNDCERMLMRLTGLNNLLMAYAKVETEE